MKLGRPTEAATRADVGAKPVAAGVRWSLIGLVSKQALRIVFTLVLARLLGPTNFGIIGQATIYLALTTVFLDMGIGAALIQRTTVTRKDEGTAASMTLIAAVGLVALTMVTAPAMAAFFHTPELTTVLRVLSLSFLINGIAVTPTAMLSRNLRFRPLGIGESVSTLLGGTIGIASAFMGAGYWALVIQTLSRDLIFLLILVAVRGVPPFTWSSQSWNSLASFSRNVLGAQLLGVIKSNADNILIGRYLGAPALAQYALSYRVLMLPVQILGQTTNRLMLPVLSQLNENKDRALNAYFRSTTSLTLVTAPLMMLVAFNAPRAVPWFFGADWQPAVRPMQVLAIAAIMRTVLSNTGNMVLAAGHAKLAFRWELFSSTIHILAFVVGLRWGIEGVAWSFLLTGLPLAAVYLAVVDSHIGIGLKRYAKALMPSATGMVGLALAWLSVDRLLADTSSTLVTLIVVSLAGLSGYLVAVAAIWPAILREQIEFVRLVGNRKASR